MPGLGKSGTPRMRLFSCCSMSVVMNSRPATCARRSCFDRPLDAPSVFDPESGASSGCADVGDLHVINPRPRRSVPHRTLEPVEGLGVAFRGDLDPAVGRVPHPAVHAFAGGSGVDEVAEAHTLHATS